MTNESAEIKRLKALLAKKDEKEKAATAEIKKTKVSNKAKTESNKKWKDKYMELKKESKSKDAELKKKRRLSQGMTEELFDLLSRQLKDTHSGQK